MLDSENLVLSQRETKFLSGGQATFSEKSAQNQVLVGKIKKRDWNLGFHLQPLTKSPKPRHFLFPDSCLDLVARDSLELPLCNFLLLGLVTPDFRQCLDLEVAEH
ncbi:MAG: hypothetical protein ACK56F_08725 [bacterium]